jgi:hypothetical protein
LLADLRTVFGDEEQMTTKHILADLCLLEDAPWNDLKGKPITDNQLARRLRQYGVKSRNVRIGDLVPKGYVRADLYDVWRRYLPPLADKPATSATAATSPSFQDVSVAAAKNEAATDEAEPLRAEDPDVAPVAGGVEVCSASTDAGNADEMGFVAPVAAVAPFRGNGRGARTDGSATGLSHRSIVDLARWYIERADDQRQGSGDVDSTVLDAGLRQVLAEQVLPESIEVEFERVMAEVFRV